MGRTSDEPPSVFELSQNHDVPRDPVSRFSRHRQLDYWFSSRYSIEGKSITIIGDGVDEQENYFDEDDRDDIH